MKRTIITDTHRLDWQESFASGREFPRAFSIGYNHPMQTWYTRRNGRVTRFPTLRAAIDAAIRRGAKR